MAWTRSRRWGLVAALASTVVAVVVLLIVSSEVGSLRRDNYEGIALAPGGLTDASGDSPKLSGESSAPRTPLVRLTPEDVIGNPDCVMTPGTGNAGDLAMVVVPTSAGSRFALVDVSGVVYGDSLPFDATGHHAFARRPDGSVLAAFAQGVQPGNRRPWWSNRTQGVRTYHDGQVIYESDQTWQWRIASDGSSFFVVEPMAGGVSRLVVRNLDLRIESHFDLAGLHPTFGDGAAGAFVEYSRLDSSQVVLSPVSPRGSSDLSIWLFPTDGGEPMELPPEARGPGSWRFGSSRDGYFTVLDDDGRTSIVRRVFGFEKGESSVEQAWSRDASWGTVSDDGVWLAALRDRRVHVLEASTGRTVWEGRVPIAQVNSVRIQDGKLVLDVLDGDVAEIRRCRAPQVDAEACFEALSRRGGLRRLYAVTVLRPHTTTYEVEHDGSPDHYRVEFGENPHCGSGEDPFGTLEVRDAQLVYVPRT